MKMKYLAAGALIAAFAVTQHAQADTFTFGFHGAGLSGAVTLTYIPDPNTGILPSTPPNAFDPIGAYTVTDISGTFTDANIGVFNQTITGVVLPNSAIPPETTNLLAPKSFSFYVITNGVPVPNPPGPPIIVPGLTYDDLYYPGGSPQTASDYPGAGGFLDIYGLMFTLDNGDAVNFWSDGDFGGGATYGAAVTDGVNLLDYVDPGVALPEPGSLWLFGPALLLGGLALRRRSNASRSVS